MKKHQLIDGDLEDSIDGTKNLINQKAELYNKKNNIIEGIDYSKKGRIKLNELSTEKKKINLISYENKIPNNKIISDIRQKIAKEKLFSDLRNDTNKVSKYSTNSLKTPKTDDLTHKENNNINDENINNNKLTNNLINNKERRKKSYYGKFYFSFVIIMLLYHYFSYIFLIEYPKIKNHKGNIFSIIRIIYFNLLFLLLSISLFLTSLTNPGTTPIYWGFRIGDEDYKKKRYCLLCQLFKPERTHHCSVCNLCILNMDHHCPWVDNCIGFYNRKFFLQLICYFFLISFSLCILYLPYSINVIKEIIRVKGKGIFKYVIGNFLILFNNLIALGFTIIDFKFTKYHFWLISKNKTTIEYLDIEFTKNKNYDIGLMNNWKQVMGENILLWFIPININKGAPVGDGLCWPCKEDLILMDNINQNSEKSNSNDKNLIEVNSQIRTNSQSENQFNKKILIYGTGNVSSRCSQDQTNS